MVEGSLRQMAGEDWEAAGKEFVSVNPMKRFGKPEEVVSFIFIGSATVKLQNRISSCKLAAVGDNFHEAIGYLPRENIYPIQMKGDAMYINVKVPSAHFRDFFQL